MRNTELDALNIISKQILTNALSIANRPVTPAFNQTIINRNRSA